MRALRLTVAVWMGCALGACAVGVSDTNRSHSAVAPELERGLSALSGDVEQNRRNRIAIFEGNGLASRVFEEAMNTELRTFGLTSLTYLDHPMTLETAAMGEVIGEGLGTPVDPTTPVGVPETAACAFAMPTPAVDTSSMSCRYLVSSAQDHALVRSSQALVDEPLYDEFADEAPDPDEVRGWYATALVFGIDAAAPHALDALRLAGVCDQEPTPADSAFERGVAIGRDTVRTAVRAQEARTPRTQCDVDWIVMQAVSGLDSGGLASDSPLCPGFEASSSEQAAHLAAATRELTAGIEAGIAEGSRDEQARLVREWTCEIPDDGGGGGDAGGGGDPLVLDLDGDGVHVVPQSVGAFFDFGDTGTVLTQWLSWGDGFLVFDRNRDDSIEASELFGDVSILEDGARAVDGVAALALYDAEERGGNADGRIDAEDAVFGELEVWVDRDGDARTDEGELRSLSEVGIVSLEMEYGRFIRANGDEGHAVDVWFEYTRL